MARSKIEWLARPGTIPESWVDIPGYPGYKVSLWGQIFSSKSNRILQPITSQCGHYYVFLYDGHGKRDKVWVHRAVLLAFVGTALPGQECRHLDGNPGNNCLNNLQWGTRQENVEDRRRHGRMPIPHESGFTKLHPADIPKIRELKHQGYSSRAVGKIYETSHTTILKVWRGERWKGY